MPRRLEARVKVIYEFEDTEELGLLPLAARRALDLAGERLSLEGWRSLSLPERMAVATAGAMDEVETDLVSASLTRARPPSESMEPVADPDPRAPPAVVLEALGAARSLDAATWATLRPLDRYVFLKLASRGRTERLAAAWDEIVGALRSHIGPHGEARMVDVAAKPVSHRRAVASARVRMKPDVLERVVARQVEKGDVFAVARVAGIQAAKRTPEIIPLCHSVALVHAEVEFHADRPRGEVLVRATMEALDRTGVEMEAMVGAGTAAMTIYDMVKGMDRWVVVTDLQLDEKSGGRSGTLVRASNRDE